MTFRRRRPHDGQSLAVRPGSTVKRDVYKVATAGVTGATAFGALAVTGAVAGTAAHDQAAKEQQVAPPAPPAVQPVTKRRKHRTVVRTRVLHAVTTGVTSAGSGGLIRSSASGGGSTHTSGSSGSSHVSGTAATTHSAPTTTHSTSTQTGTPAAPAPSSGS